MQKKEINKLPLENRFTYKKRNVFYAHDFNAPGARFQIVYFAPNANIEPHYHKVGTEMFFITKGDGVIKVNKTSHKVKEDMALMINSNDIHEIYAGKSGLTIAVFKVNESIEDIHWLKNNEKS